MRKLQIILPDGTESTHELTEDVVTVGRLSDNAIRIDDASVSSHHAQFTLSGGEYQLKDLNSTNGTRVNFARRRQAAFWKDRGILSFGSHRSNATDARGRAGCDTARRIEPASG
jgi:pSer/pThr/pTyr-binding forkhead associated (FHA) protein